MGKIRTSRHRLTNAVINKHLLPPQEGVDQVILYDTDVTGFGIYRTSEKPGRYFVHFRVGQRQRKKTLGRITEISLTDARTEAAELKLAGQKGRDLIADQKAATAQGITLGEAYEAYLEALRRKDGSPGTFINYNQNWNNCLKRYANKELQAITKADLRKWHTSWGDRGPTIANQTLRLFRGIYNHALKVHEGLPANPATAVDPFKERQHRPILTWDELPDWWVKVEKLKNPTRRAYWKFLLFSGLRRVDAATLKWEDVHDDHIHRPCPKGGKDRAFDLPLSPQLEEILREARDARDKLHPNSPYVFPAHSKSGHIETTAEKSIPGISPHMLRRTFATACIEAGLDPYTVKRLLNHQLGGNDVTAIYLKPSETHLGSSAIRVSNFLQLHLKNTLRPDHP